MTKTFVVWIGICFFMDKKYKQIYRTFNLVSMAGILISAFFLCIGPAIANNDISKATYLNSEYILENTEKLNDEINGAWTTNYKYYWIVNQYSPQKNLPSYTKEISYNGIIEENKTIGLSTLENIGTNDSRNKYFLTSSLPGETLQISVNLENENETETWYPISVYFDPLTIQGSIQQVRVKLSYATGSLGNIVYIQNLQKNEIVSGGYLNLLIKAPIKGELGTAIIEIKAEGGFKPALSGLFWDDLKESTNLSASFTGSRQTNAGNWYRHTQRRGVRPIIFSADSIDNKDFKNIVQLSLGQSDYTTTTGYEFPSSVLENTNSSKVLKGQSGSQGKNGLEFYLTPPQDTCSNGCGLGFYFVENYKQKIEIYSAEKDKKNKLLATSETNGNNEPIFERFNISPSNNTSLRVRITSNEESNIPLLRGLYIINSGSLSDEDFSNEDSDLDGIQSSGINSNEDSSHHGHGDSDHGNSNNDNQVEDDEISWDNSYIDVSIIQEVINELGNSGNNDEDVDSDDEHGSLENHEDSNLTDELGNSGHDDEDSDSDDEHDGSLENHEDSNLTDELGNSGHDIEDPDLDGHDNSGHNEGDNDQGDSNDPNLSGITNSIEEVAKAVEEALKAQEEAQKEALKMKGEAENVILINLPAPRNHHQGENH